MYSYDPLAGITEIPTARGFLYLVVVTGWYCRKILT
jgi:hypothetical protein